MDSYKDWTDDRINKEVGRHHNIYHTYEECINLLGEGSDNIVNPKYDPCNKPADAWPIITENRIAIIPTFDEWTASFGGPEKSRRSYMARNIGPLRAAMIVFLKMQSKL